MVSQHVPRHQSNDGLYRAVLLQFVVHLPQAEHHILGDVFCFVFARSVADANAESLLSPRAGLLFKCYSVHAFIPLYIDKTQKQVNVKLYLILLNSFTNLTSYLKQNLFILAFFVQRYEEILNLMNYLPDICLTIR